MEPRLTHPMGSDTGLSMAIAARMDMLCEIYEVYDKFSRSLTVACKRGCATCCTQNVTMTTLEGYRILRHLISMGRPDLLEAVRSMGHSQRFRPIFSTNALAILSMQGKDSPEEDAAYTPMPCPFLAHNECLIYQERPFGCRCFFSARLCGAEASAVVDSFWITVNTAFLQFIEHIDAGGLFGNMTDVVLFLEQEAQRKGYELTGVVDNSRGLAPNRQIPALLIPPEHQQHFQPILHQVKRIMMRQTNLGETKENFDKN